MVAAKLDLPVPRSLDGIKADPEFADDFATAALVAVVDFEPPSKSVRVNITLDEHLLAAVDRAAAARQSTRSGLLAEAARRHILGQ
jgi:predicted DNA binding CopG/RHH family protein